MRRNPNRPTNPNRHPWWIPVTAGTVALAGGGFALATMFGAFSGDRAPADNAGPLGGDTPSASASPFPGTSQSPIEIAPPVSTSPSATASETIPTTPATTATVDSYMTIRQAIAHRYTGCDLNDFTNSGIVQTKSGNRDELNLDLSYSPDGSSSDAMNANPQSHNVQWSAPQLVLRQVVNNELTSTRITQTASTGGINPSNVAAYLPVAPGVGTTYAVTVETVAQTTNGNGGYNRTVDDYVCGIIDVEPGGGANNWRAGELGGYPDINTFYTDESVGFKPLG
jgi:hypothetical protein